MKKLNRYEQGILNAYDKGTLVSAHLTKAQLEALREAACATFTKSRRVNIRLSTADLMDIQVRAQCARRNSVASLSVQKKSRMQAELQCKLPIHPGKLVNA